MKSYAATFSNGQTVTRRSNHGYRYAIGLVNKTTSQLRNVKFTASETPAPDWGGVADTVRTGYGISQQDADRFNAKAARERQNWIVEIVTL